ncbi:MAG: hypothetical protein HQ505_07695 [Nitrosopumilus sp.]|nr:hypothetical protein [Nitrosopumilus sp.]
MDNTTQILVRILTDIKKYLDNISNPKLFHECKNLNAHLNKYSISAMTTYRLRKISKLNKSMLSSNNSYLKKEIDKLIHLLTNLVSWYCKVCDKTIETEHENQLTLWVMAHEISGDHKRNIKKIKNKSVFLR